MKRKTPFVFAVTFLVLISGKGFTQTDSVAVDSIDLALQQCREVNITTHGLIACMDEAAAAWDKELNKIYQQLMKTLSVEQQELLRVSQRAWIEYRDKEMAFVYRFYDDPGLSWDYVKRGREMELTRARVLELRSYCGSCNF